MMLKENGDKRLSEHHSIYQNSVHEIATSENLKCLFIQAQEPPQAVSTHVQTTAGEALIPLLDYITVHPFLLLPEEAYISMFTEVRLGHYLTEPINVS